MKAKKFVSMLVLIAAICISSPYAMKAGGHPPPNVVTGTSLRGTVKFEGAVPKSATKPPIIAVITGGTLYPPSS